MIELLKRLSRSTIFLVPLASSPELVSFAAQMTGLSEYSMLLH